MKTMTENIHIQTERLILRTPTNGDAQAIVDAMKPVWHELQLWMSWAHEGADTVEALYAHFIGKEGSLIGVCRRTGKFVLCTGITRLEDHREDEYENGYWVAKDFLGQGYATEAANAAIRFGFQEMKAKRIHIRYYADNEKSRRIIENLGFTFVQTRPKAKARCLDGTLLDVHEYVMHDPAVLPELDVEWRKRWR